MDTAFHYVLIEDLKVWNVAVDHSSSTFMTWKHALYALIFFHGFACVFWFRLNVHLHRYSSLLARLLSVWRFYTFANDISYFADIGPGFKVNHTTDIVIGKGVRIGRNCSIYNGVTLGAKRFDHPKEKPTVGDFVIIGTGAKVLGNITIGNHAIIGALTLCTVSVPQRALAIGNPVAIKENYTTS